MKELSIEEKAKRYDEAIKNGKQILNTPYTAHWDIMKEVVEHLFPELKESEDDRIRNEIIAFVEQSIHRGGGTPIPREQEDKWLAWFEKQGEQILANSAQTCKDEQKPAWSVEDEKFFKTALWHISYSISNGKSTDEHCDTTDWFKSLKDRMKGE